MRMILKKAIVYLCDVDEVVSGCGEGFIKIDIRLSLVLENVNGCSIGWL